MMLVLSGLWPGLAAALLLGGCVGALTGLPRERHGLTAAAVPSAVLAIFAGLALAGPVPGRAGLWVETAALMLGAYLAGCLAGAIGRRAAGRG